MERLEDTLQKIVQWADAYPLDLFPEPDADYLRRAHEVLTASGMTLDRISAHAMRHVVKRIGDMAREALK